MSEIKLPFGRNAAGRMVGADEVDNGLACGCFCPKCDARLVARQGEILRHHFAHHVERECEGAGETAIHLFAKQYICESLQLVLPHVPPHDVPHDLGPMLDAQAEVQLDERRPDVWAKYASGHVAVEICVEHEVEPNKIAFYVERNVAAVEVYLHSYRDDDDAAWPDIIAAFAPRRWLNPPRDVWHAMLFHIEVERGFRPCWARNAYRDKFGDWPNKFGSPNPKPIPPSGEVTAWVEAQLAAYARARDEALLEQASENAA